MKLEVCEARERRGRERLEAQADPRRPPRQHAPAGERTDPPSRPSEDARERQDGHFHGERTAAAAECARRARPGRFTRLHDALVLLAVWLGCRGGQPTDARAESRSEHPLAGAKADRKARHVSGSQALHPGRPPRGSAQGHGGRSLCHRQGKHTTRKVAAQTREHTALSAHSGES